MEKKTYQNTLNGLGDRVDTICAEVASLRTLLKEIDKKSNFSQLSYRMLLNLLDLKLGNISGELLGMSIAIDDAISPEEDNAPTIDQDTEVTADDLPFR